MWGLVAVDALPTPWSGAAFAQSRGARPAEYVRLRQSAEQKLTQGRWDEARFEALTSLELERGLANEGALRVLVEVFFATDQPADAEATLAELLTFTPAPPELAGWLTRAKARQDVERLESAGDALAAHMALTALQPSLSTTAEKAWGDRLARRVAWRQHEQERRFAEGRAALSDALAAPSVETQDRRWLQGAVTRLDIAERFWACDWPQARERAAAAAALVELRPSDHAWIKQLDQRAQLWALAQAGDIEGTHAAMAGLGLDEQDAWARGLSRWMAYSDALARPAWRQDEAALAALWAEVTSWQAAEPPGVRLPPPPDSSTPAPSSWLVMGASSGVASTRHFTTGEGEALVGALCEDDPCLQTQVGVQVAALWVSDRSLGAWNLGVLGRARVLEPWLLTDGAPKVWPLAQAHVSFALTQGRLTMGLGPRLAMGLEVWGQGDWGDADGWNLVDPLLDVSVRLALPNTGLDLGASAAVGPWLGYGAVELGWSAPSRPIHLGLNGLVARGSRASAASPDEAKIQRLDWQAGVNVAWQREWR